MSTAAAASDRRTLIADTAIALVAAAGLRGLTHRAVDSAAALPAGSTSYYFRTRTALIGACYRRLAELDLADAEDDGGALAGPGGPAGPPDRDAVAAALAAMLHRWLTTGRARQLARYELSLEAARTPELEADLHEAGRAARSRAADLLGALGATDPRASAELLVAWADGLLYDRLAGALARSRPAPDRAELAAVCRRMLDAALAP
ncbi:TetR family transcriptional regulator [Streptomyces bambusae]|uniref:TetR/AcrR family transcriptional regulator n=1 Tax=Streptomyces bambusae TaxID=1550616 RepID=UPI001CFE6477|nr:TetR/AcrR family transcriptional regulator [Streptomyces bambusae]MCB5165455.1 TetR family transcriptional regulator [Streptomyces bambusae]